MKMQLTEAEIDALAKIEKASTEQRIDVKGARVIRTSSRACLGVEHGDYNGTKLFGFGTDRFIWFAYRPNGGDGMRLFSTNYSSDGIVDFDFSKIPSPKSSELKNRWARFPYGVSYVLRQSGYNLPAGGIDGIIFSNIPGGGMSRSASLSLNLILAMLDVNNQIDPKNVDPKDAQKIVDMAQKVENDYIGSPCGILDQTMIMYSKANQGTLYNPSTREIQHVPYGGDIDDFRFVVLDTGTDRPGLENSTYAIRSRECETFVEMLDQAGYGIKKLADIVDCAVYNEIVARYNGSHSHLVNRLKYIHEAQQRFNKILSAWKEGYIETVGANFNEDGKGLRDKYQISGYELEVMVDIARQVPGVLGARMLGGGDAGARSAGPNEDPRAARTDDAGARHPWN